MQTIINEFITPTPATNEEINYFMLNGQTLYNGTLKNAIGWCDETFNIVTGCSKYSDGCLNCYSFAMTRRCQYMHPNKYQNGMNVTTHPEMLLKRFPDGHRKYIFVCSMSDLFHDEVPDEFILDSFRFINANQQHTFIILTKRAERLFAIAPKLMWTENIWCGVTVESEKYLYRLDLLRKVPAVIRFISAEPLLSSIKDADLSGIDLVLTQGESGNNARPINPEWITELRDLCADAGICFFFKGWGGRNKKESGDLLEGVRYKQLPIQYEIINNRRVSLKKKK